MSEDDPILVFDESSKAKIIKLLGFKEEDSLLIDEEGLVQTNQQYEPVSAKDFGGVLKGSKIVIKKDQLELARYFASK